MPPSLSPQMLAVVNKAFLGPLYFFIPFHILLTRCDVLGKPGNCHRHTSQPDFVPLALKLLLSKNAAWRRKRCCFLKLPSGKTLYFPWFVKYPYTERAVENFWCLVNCSLLVW